MRLLRAVLGKFSMILPCSMSLYHSLNEKLGSTVAKAVFIWCVVGLNSTSDYIIMVVAGWNKLEFYIYMFKSFF